MTHHLVVIHAEYLDAILRKRKTIECRFSSIRRPPFEAVAPGDLLWFKLPSGPLRGVAAVQRCEFRIVSDPAVLRELARRHHAAVAAPAQFWQADDWARYASLIWLGDVVPVTPMRVHKRSRLAWVVLDGPPRPDQRIDEGSRGKVRGPTRSIVRAAAGVLRPGRVRSPRS